MSAQLSDEDVDTALRGWARQSIATGTARPFTVPTGEDSHTEPTNRRWLRPALAAAVILVLAGTAVIIRTARTTGSTSGASATTDATHCPRLLPAPSTLKPPPGTPGGSLYPRPVRSMTACTYSITGPDEVDSKLLSIVPIDATLSANLAQHLNHAAHHGDDGEACLAFIGVDVLLARDESGTPFPLVTLTTGCGQLTATNGRVSRHLDLNDPALNAMLKAIKPFVRYSPSPAR